jgi:5'-nucleotidase (lipoprotein e(P4) family)
MMAQHKLVEFKSRGTGLQSGEGQGNFQAINAKPPAVVMDLDETILDNGWFQSRQLRDQVSFDDARWMVWEDQGAAYVRAVPGAIMFVKKLRELGIAPVYLTNRNERARTMTMQVLQRLEIEVPEDQLLCASATTGTNKTSRREQIAAKFEVLLYVGDNLRDFDEQFRFDEKLGAAGRDAVVERLSEKFGIEWIILPNPIYGEWTKVFRNDLQLLK